MHRIINHQFNDITKVRKTKTVNAVKDYRSGGKARDEGNFE